MTYKCIFPGCQYSTEERSMIEFHHIHPRELNPVLGKDVVVPLCPNHHRHIYHAESRSGAHSRRTRESYEISSVSLTTTGTAVTFKAFDGTESVAYVDTRVSDVPVRELSWNAVDGIVDRPCEDLELVPPEVDRDGYFAGGPRVYYVSSRRREACRELSRYIKEYADRVARETEELCRGAREDVESLLEGNAWA